MATTINSHDTPVLDSWITTTRSGAESGRALVFLHGNPASSTIWQHVVAALPDRRVLAPDLIGMGASGKPDVAYSLDDHARYLDAWFDAEDLDDVVLIGHDWGGALAVDWARRHPDRVAGIAVMEAVLRSIPLESISPQAIARTQMIRSGEGERFVLDTDQFIRTAFTAGVMNAVDAGRLATYLAPFPTPASRRPILAWARQLPVGGEPRAVVERLQAAHGYLAASTETPKLLIRFHGSPTLVIGDDTEQWCRDTFASLDVADGGASGHHAPEDRPDAVAHHLSEWFGRRGV